jgi:hypothetical protein
MTKINKVVAKELSKKYNINHKVVSEEEWHYGLNVELEHGSKLSKLTNISHNNPDITAKIVIAHLLEDPRYYKYLRKMEIQREKFWNNKQKPSVFN